jgi:hypothetical protein
LRVAVEKGGIDELLAKWRQDAAAFQKAARAVYLY